MKVSLINVVMFGTGVILLYSGIKAYDPRDVIRWGLGGKKPKRMESSHKTGREWKENEEEAEKNAREGKPAPDGWNYLT